MSVWGDIRKRGLGEELKKEDITKYLSKKEIEQRLKDMVVGVGPGTYPPVKLHILTVEIQKGINVFNEIHTIADGATIHSDGTRNYYSEASVNKILDVINTTGPIIDLQ